MFPINTCKHFETFTFKSSQSNTKCTFYTRSLANISPGSNNDKVVDENVQVTEYITSSPGENVHNDFLPGLPVIILAYNRIKSLSKKD